MSAQTETEADAPETRAGYIALIGRPNAGKSTLMNRLIGQKLSIVTAKAQTTWQRVTGILSTESAQAVFVDTPGLLVAKDLLQMGMLEEALQAVRDADVVVLLVDSTDPLHDSEKKAIKEALSLTSAPVFVVINKIDEARPEQIAAIAHWGTVDLRGQVRGVSALKGAGVEELGQELAEALPPGPFLYPADEVASAPVRFFVGEFVRETVIERFRKEIPYAVFVVVEEFREDQDPVYIGASVFVETKSQKRILVGEKGKAIRELGRVSREKIQEFIDRPVYLDLWIKVLPKWRKRRQHLKRLGLRVPAEGKESA